jgi:putative phosphonate metabolism protein
MRYAIYFAPALDHPLTALANGWLGRDAASGEELPQVTVEGLDAEDLAALTADPRRYGFHATLKAPFELANGTAEYQLIDAFERFAAERRAFTLPRITLGQLGPFFALIPAEESDELDSLAADCVRAFEPFRAPLSEADILRRKPEKLSPSERHHLETWGYPYVFEEFRFHMTLTGPTLDAQRDVLKTAIDAHFAEILDRPLAIDHLALFIETERGAPFTVLRITPLQT